MNEGTPQIVYITSLVSVITLPIIPIVSASPTSCGRSPSTSARTPCPISTRTRTSCPGMMKIDDASNSATFSGALSLYVPLFIFDFQQNRVDGHLCEKTVALAISIKKNVNLYRVSHPIIHRGFSA